MSTGTHTPQIVTLGESLGLLTPVCTGTLQHSRELRLSIGGAESNVAIGLARLGVPTAWFGRVGEDAIGDLVVKEIRGEGVSAHVVRDASAPTALMIKEQRADDDTRIWYYRAASAGSRLTPDDLDVAVLEQARILHVTGISLALSPTMADTVEFAVRHARAAGATISFDLNYRSKLWDRETAGAAYRRLLPMIDIIFGNEFEIATALGDDHSLPELIQRLTTIGASEVVIKQGVHGAYGWADGRGIHQAAIPITPVDTVGAGDAFVAGYLAERLVERPLVQRLKTGTAVAARVCMVRGDWEGAPSWADLERTEQAIDEVSR